jgi:hypothetical protein
LQRSTFSIVMTTGCPEFEGSAYQAARISMSVVCHSMKKKVPYGIVMCTFGT